MTSAELLGLIGALCGAVLGVAGVLALLYQVAVKPHIEAKIVVPLAQTHAIAAGASTVAAENAEKIRYHLEPPNGGPRRSLRSIAEGSEDRLDVMQRRQAADFKRWTDHGMLHARLGIDGYTHTPPPRAETETDEGSMTG